MSGLTILVVSGDPVRFRSAATTALAGAALGTAVRLFLDAAAVPLLVDRSHRELIDEMTAAGIPLTACQTGLADAGIAFASLPSGIEAGGILAILAALGGDQLIAI